MLALALVAVVQGFKCLATENGLSKESVDCGSGLSLVGVYGRSYTIPLCYTMSKFEPDGSVKLWSSGCVAEGSVFGVESIDGYGYDDGFVGMSGSTGRVVEIVARRHSFPSCWHSFNKHSYWQIGGDQDIRDLEEIQICVCDTELCNDVDDLQSVPVRKGPVCSIGVFGVPNMTVSTNIFHMF